MLFNSIDYALFLPIVFVIYWFFTNKNLKVQNALLLVSSYYFYACWDWRFLFLLIFSTLLDYFTGLQMTKAKNDNLKKIWFWLSISINLGFLGVFKYFNFFIDSFSELLLNFGVHVNDISLNLILPVGISFYTFHGLSYVIDIYKSKIKPERNFVDYAVFVSFFPLLVAGPIERATHLLPQIKKKRFFDYFNAANGLRQILWGLFKKVVIADNCAEYANLIFNNSNEYNSSTLVLGAIFFAFQIYGDFSGYSDIAIGTARLFGIELLRNFAFPYFSRDIAEFWRRWHISLTTWFRDYLYIPLGGSKGGTWMKIRNTFIIFIVSGFWHGANWTFLMWGVINAIYFIPLLLTQKNRNNIEIVAQGRKFPTFKEFIKIIITFLLVVFAWIFFRAESLNHAIAYISNIFTSSLISVPNYEGFSKSLLIIALIILFMIIEWFGRELQYGIEWIRFSRNTLFRWLCYLVIFFCILIFAGNQHEFIYFQF